MPARHDLDPVAMTEEERLEKRRFEAGFVFEMMSDQQFRMRSRYPVLYTVPARALVDGEFRLPEEP